MEPSAILMATFAACLLLRQLMISFNKPHVPTSNP